MSLNNLSSLTVLITKTFRKIETRLKKEQPYNSNCNAGNTVVTDGELRDLSGIFGETLDRAAEIILNGSIKLYKRQVNNRTIIEIAGSNDSVYRFFPNTNYCPCEAYQYHVLKSRSEYTCKHILAAKIALLCLDHRIVTEVMPDAQFNVIVESITATGFK
ncbi:hypothetical protein HA402_004441 [Bradysia odoriphaga]|nr:hypothetical protein HA402_004441 [Bradysia odoriphaga]